MLRTVADEPARGLMVRNGHAHPRSVTTAAGAVEVVAPWINDKRVDADTAQRVRIRSVTLSPWCWKSPKVVEVLPLLYLHGLPVLAVQMKPSRPVVDRTTEAP